MAVRIEAAHGRSVQKLVQFAQEESTAVSLVQESYSWLVTTAAQMDGIRLPGGRKRTNNVLSTNTDDGCSAAKKRRSSSYCGVSIDEPLFSWPGSNPAWPVLYGPELDRTNNRSRLRQKNWGRRTCPTQWALIFLARFKPGLARFIRAWAGRHK
jgi:hypothetical protein